MGTSRHAGISTHPDSLCSSVLPAHLPCRMSLRTSVAAPPLRLDYERLMPGKPSLTGSGCLESQRSNAIDTVRSSFLDACGALFDTRIAQSSLEAATAPKYTVHPSGAR